MLDSPSGIRSSLSIAGGTTPDRRSITPAPPLSPELIERIREVSRQSRAVHPLPPGVAVQIVFHR